MMYSVILVDDSMPVLHYLSRAVPWEQLGFQLAGSFSDPEEALTYGQQHAPDVLITDIGMPKIDGIQLIASLKQTQQSLMSVIISCHGEFAYAQQAVKLGVQDYLLKENLTADQLVPILEQIRQRLDQAQSHSSEHQRLQEDHLRHRLLIKRKFTSELLSGSIQDPEYGIQRLTHFGLDTRGKMILPVYYTVTANEERKQRFHDLDLLSFTVENIVEEIVEHSGTAVHLSKSPGEGFVWFALPVRSGAQQEMIVHEVMYQLIYSVQKFAKAEIVTVCGSKTLHWQEAMNDAIQLQAQADRYFYLPPSTLCDSTHRLDFQKESDLFANYGTASESLALALLPDGEINFWINNWIERLKQERYHPETVKTFMLKLAIDWQLKQQQLHERPFAFSVEELHREMGHIRHIHELTEWMNIRFGALAVLSRDWTLQANCRSEIIHARNYVEQHMNRLVKLEEVAEHLHLNASYFSRLFKKETGETFIEYATRVKMQRAKEWITAGNGTVDEVSQMLGYQYKSYFLKLYKLYTGHTPVKSKGDTI